MTRRLVPFLLLSALVLPAFGVSQASNALMQSLEGEASSWVLEKEEGTSSLYFEGELVSQRIVTQEGYVLKEDGSETRVVLDPAGRPILIESRDLVERLEYDEYGRLESTSLCEGDGLERIMNYYWSDSGDLLLVEEVDVRYYFQSDIFSFSSDGDTYMEDPLLVEENVVRVGDQRSSIEVLEDGIKLVQPSGKEKLYSTDGRLLSTTEEGRMEKYSYSEDGLLVEKRSYEGSLLVISYYQEGREIRREYYQDKVKIREQDFREDGLMEEIRYRGGKAYARLVYEKDHESLRSVEGL